MLGAIKYGLTHLVDFSGRDARQTFWYYVLFLVVVQVLVGIVAFIPSLVQIFSATMDAVQAGADEETMQMAIAQTMPETMRQQMTTSLFVSLGSCILFAASFVRRLHDAGYTGWIAIVPIVTVLASVWLTYSSLDLIVEATQQTIANPESGGFLGIQQNVPNYGAIGWLGYLVVVGFGVLKSQNGPNRYGDAPVQF